MVIFSNYRYVFQTSRESHRDGNAVHLMALMFHLIEFMISLRLPLFSWVSQCDKVIVIPAKLRIYLPPLKEPSTSPRENRKNDEFHDLASLHHNRPFRVIWIKIFTYKILKINNIYYINYKFKVGMGTRPVKERTT